jgi:hypothetical protein
VPPRLDDRARFPEAAEHVLVKALVAQLAIERFDEGVLPVVSDNGTELTSGAVLRWATRRVAWHYIEPGKPSVWGRTEEAGFT